MEVRESADTSAEGLLSLERKSVQPFATQDEYLYAMKEDLADWFNTLYNLQIGVADFYQHIDTGVLLCQHANYVQTFLPTADGVDHDVEVVYRSAAKSGSFLARDNIANFIAWCRHRLGITDVLLFETNDLVDRANERNVVLCLLEVARRGAKYGVLAPVLIQMEEEIEAELAASEPEPQQPQQPQEPQPVRRTPMKLPQRPPVDMMSLDEMVRDILGQCTCPDQFPMIRVSEGKYQIGDSRTLIFVRILRNHVMVRIGGGWDTLENYLDRHDPCRCHVKGHRSPRRHLPAIPRTPQSRRRASAPAPAVPISAQSRSRATTPDISGQGAHVAERNNRYHHVAESRCNGSSEPESHTAARQPSYHHTFHDKNATGGELNAGKSAYKSFQQGLCTPSAKTNLLKKFNSRENLSVEEHPPAREKPRPSSAKTRSTTSTAGKLTCAENSTGNSSRCRTDKRQEPRSRQSRSHSIGAPMARNQGLSKTMPASILSGMLGNQTKTDTLIISRDSSGRHHIDNDTDTGQGKRITSTRMNISPKRILPDKPKAITRSATVATFNLSGIHAEDADNRPVLQKSTSVEETARPAPSASRTSRSISETGSCDGYVDETPPSQYWALNAKMERLFEEYRRQEMQNNGAHNFDSNRSDDHHRVGISRLHERQLATDNKQHLTSKQRPSRPSTAGTLHGRDRTANTRSSPASASVKDVGNNRPRSAGLSRRSPGPQSPVNMRRSLSRSRGSLLDETDPPQRAHKSANNRPVTPVNGQSAQRYRRNSKEDLLDGPKVNRSRPTTPSHKTTGKSYRYGSREDLLDNCARNNSRPSTPTRRTTGQSYRRASRDDILDTSSANSSRPRTPVGGSTAQRSRRNSREDILDSYSNSGSRPGTPVGRNRPQHGSSENLLNDVRSRGRGGQRSLRSSREDLLEFTDSASYEAHAGLAESVRAKPRKDKRDNSRTRIPLPVNVKQQMQNAQAEFAAGCTLKRYDSGVDINNMSPTDSSLQGEDESFQCDHLEAFAMANQSMSYADDKRRQQDYF